MGYSSDTDLERLNFHIQLYLVPTDLCRYRGDHPDRYIRTY
jgi:hypothetical protein